MPTDPALSFPHDSLFKHVFSNANSGAALLRAVLTEPVSRRIDWGTLELRSGTFKDVELGGLESDLLFSAQLDGQLTLFYFLVEHQSSVDGAMVWRIWRYVTRIWERWVADSGSALELPLVVPIVVYHGARPWSAPRRMRELLAVDSTCFEELPVPGPELAYVLDDLTLLDAEALRARGLPAFATLALWALRTASDRGFAPTARDLVDVFEAVRTSPDGRAALWTIFSYLSTISAHDEDLVGAVAGYLSQPAREHVMDLVEHFAETKRAEGRVEGRVEGRQAILLKLLTLKFGPVSERARQLVADAEEGRLDRWAERTLTAASEDDVFTD